MIVWIIVLSVTIINMDAPRLLSNFAFTSQEQCLMAIQGEPLSDHATCRPLKLVPPPQADRPKGESIDP